MKCSNCNSEWNTESDVKDCPFCGQKLILMNTSAMEVSQVLKSIIEERGIEIFTTPKLVISLIADLIVNHEREKKLLRIAADSCVFNEISIIVNEKSEAQRSLHIQKTRQKLMDDSFLSLEIVNELLSILLYSIGLTINGVDIQNVSTETNTNLECKKSTSEFGNKPNSYEALLDAAISGNEVAQFMLGFCNFYGVLVERNVDDAEKWYRKSVETGYWLAKYELAMVLFSKEAGSKDKSGINRREIYELFHSMSESGHMMAYYYCGVCFKSGVGVEKNLDKAFEYFKLSALPNNTDDNKIVDLYFASLDYISDIATLHERFEKYANKYKEDVVFGAAKAIQVIANEYQKCSNYFNKQDCKKAFEMFKSLADRKDPMGYFELAYCYQHGFGVEQNMEEADKWYSLGEENINGLSRDTFNDILKDHM